jgi:hypothetical protein
MGQVSKVYSFGFDSALTYTIDIPTHLTSELVVLVLAMDFLTSSVVLAAIGLKVWRA